MERNGYPEETYYTFSYSPIPNDDGSVGGIICANSDDTQRVIGERQLALLRDLAADTADARNWQEACERSAAALGSESARPAVRDDLHGRTATPRALTLAGACRHRRRAIRPRPRRSRSTTRRPGRSARCCAIADARIVRGSAARFGARLPAGPWAAAADAGGGAADSADRRHRPRRRAGRRPQSRSACSTTDYRGFLGLVAGQIARRDRQRRRPTRRSAGAPRRWPRSIAPRPRSSPTSATSSARR